LTRCDGVCIVTYMNHTATANIPRALRALHSAQATADGYRAMYAIAQKQNMEYEMERITFQIEEFEAEAESLRDRLVELGYDPATA